MASSLEEAQKLIADGEKYLKTGLFKWRADYDSAAPCFHKAAQTHKNLKKLEKARELFLLAADCHYRNQARFHAAKSYEEAGLVSRDLNKMDDFCAHFDHASDLYMEEGTPDTAAMCLIRAGKTLEQKNGLEKWALTMFEKAADIYKREAEEGRTRTAAEVVGRISRLLVKMGEFERAVTSIEEERKLYGQCEGGDHGASGRLVCCQTLIYLQMHDQVRAEKCVTDACAAIEGFGQSEGHHALRELIHAYESRDQAQFSAVVRQPLFRHMDACYARLTRTLKVPGYSESGLANAKGATDLKEGPAAGGDDDDDGLC